MVDELISRRAALDTIMGQPPEPHYPTWYAAQIEKLPAAQPDHNADSDKKVSISCGQENDQISRQALCKYAQNQKDKIVTPNDIMRFPSAQPGIVRCKDCKWYELPSHRITENCVLWMKSNGILLPIKPDDYCSYAERRTDG